MSTRNRLLPRGAGVAVAVAVAAACAPPVAAASTAPQSSARLVSTVPAAIGPFETSGPGWYVQVGPSSGQFHGGGVACSYSLIDNFVVQRHVYCEAYGHIFLVIVSPTGLPIFTVT